MNPKRFAILGGWILVLLGLAAFIPALNTPGGRGVLPLTVDTSAGLFLSLLPLNIFNKVAMLLFGLSGLAASREPGWFDAPEAMVLGGNGWSTPVADPYPNSVVWSRAVCVMMGTLAVLGMIPATRTLFGIWPLYGGDLVFHAIFALAGGYFGFAHPMGRLRVTRSVVRDQVPPRRAA